MHKHVVKAAAGRLYAAPGRSGTAPVRPRGTMAAMSDPTLSRRSMRNAALRAALRAAHPRTTFTVRNGAGGIASLVWTDGPTGDQVSATVATVSSGVPGRPWAAQLIREETAQLHAAAYLSARAAGDLSWYTEEPGEVPHGPPRVGWQTRARLLDAATVTPQQWEAARVAVALTAAQSGPGRTESGIRALARFIATHGDVLDAVTGDTSWAPPSCATAARPRPGTVPS